MQPPDESLPAGEFGAWLREVHAAIDGGGETDVACGSCVGCCASSQFIQIAPDERDALAHIPKALLFPAPRLPHGHMVMGYDTNGRCPMLRDDGCSIYEYRPRTCRAYDCRVFPAAGMLPDDDPSKAPIVATASRWQFSYDSAEARVLHQAVEAAAQFVRTHAAELEVPTTTQVAVAAIRTHALFRSGPPTIAAVAVELSRRPRPR